MVSSDYNLCRILDPNDTYANVRNFPNGALIGPLLNDTRVSLVDIKKDSEGRDWALIKYGDKVGFIMNSLIACP